MMMETLTVVVMCKSMRELIQPVRLPGPTPAALSSGPPHPPTRARNTAVSTQFHTSHCGPRLWSPVYSHRAFREREGLHLQEMNKESKLSCKVDHILSEKRKKQAGEGGNGTEK